MEPDPLIAEHRQRWQSKPVIREIYYHYYRRIASLLFGRHRRRFEKSVNQFEIVTLRRFSFFAYPLSGGFKDWSLLPVAVVRPLLKIEDKLEPLLGSLMAFRLLAVLERR